VDKKKTSNIPIEQAVEYFVKNGLFDAMVKDPDAYFQSLHSAQSMMMTESDVATIKEDTATTRQAVSRIGDSTQEALVQFGKKQDAIIVGLGLKHIKNCSH
jgi:hypothetical protein